MADDLDATSNNSPKPPIVPIARQPDYTGFTINDAVPTALIGLPTYTGFTTIVWQTNVASISSEISSLLSSASASASAPAEKNPSATDPPALTLLPPARHKLSSSTVIGVVVAIVGILTVCVILAAFSIVYRQRRRRRVAAQRHSGSSREMIHAAASHPSMIDARPYIREPSASSSPSLLPSQSFTAQPPQIPQPPALLSTTMDQSYFTGLDTADSVSIGDSHRLSTIASPPYTASPSMLEAPPPYRPRSVVSRENSTRMSARPPSYGPRLSTRSTNHQQSIVSPFDDPEDERSTAADNSPPSPIVSPTGEDEMRDMEEMSEVSELSYQEEPTMTHPPI